MQGLTRVKGEGVTAVFAEVFKDVGAALVRKFGLRGVFEVRADVDG